MTAVADQPLAAGPAPAPREPLSRGRFLGTWWLAALAITSLFVVAFALVLSNIQEHSAQKRLYRELRHELADPPKPDKALPTDHPVALLQIPRLGLKGVVVEGTEGSALRAGPGHRRDTVLPGSQGVSVLYGRSVTYGAPFASLSSLRKGDTITTASVLGTATYVVDDVRRRGDALPEPLPAGGARLVLASVDGKGWRAGISPQHEVFVDATMTGTTKALSATQAPTTSGEQLAATDSSGLVMLVFWLQLLVFVLIGLVWGIGRVGLAKAWVAGMPAVLALLWLATNAGFALLPNVF